MSAKKGNLLAPAGMLRRIAAAPRVFWFLDFDGTLVGIRRDPEKVALGTEAREAVAGISGREDAASPSSAAVPWPTSSGR